MPFSLALDSTQIACFLTCPTQWHNRFVLNLQKRDRLPSKARDIGTVIHGLLERYYHKRAEGISVWDAYKYSLECLKKDLSNLGLSSDDLSFLKDRFLQYCAKYQDNDFEVGKKSRKVLVEQGFSYKLLDTSDYLFILEGRIDLIGFINDRGNRIPIIVDHKSQGSSYLLYDRSIQFKNYSLVLGIPNLVINYIGTTKKLDENTFRRQLITFHIRELEIWKEEVLRIFFEVSSALMFNKFEKRWSACAGFRDNYCEFTKLCECPKQNVRNEIIKLEYEKKEEWVPWKET